MLNFNQPQPEFLNQFQSLQPTASSAFGAASANAAGTAQAPHSNPVSGGAKQALNKLGSAVSSISKGVDKFGYNTFGIGTPTSYSYAAQGAFPWQQAGSVANSSMAGSAGVEASGFSGGLGSIAGGAFTGLGLGGLIGGWVGGSPVGSSIGGAIGGAIGAASGISSGIALGSTLGSVVPGLGTVLGAIGGSLVGGMFGGGKTPHPEGAIRNSTINPDGSISIGTFSGKHTSADQFSPAIQDFSKYLTSQAKKYGIQYNPEAKVYFGGAVDNWATIGGNGPNLLSTYTGDSASKAEYWDTGKSFFDWADTDARQVAYEKAFNNLVTMSGYDINNLKPIYPTSASEIRVQRESGPSDWDNFIANFRAKQGQQA